MTHVETDTKPECTVVLGAGRLKDNDRTDDRRIELTFEQCFYTRTGCGWDALGYRVEPEFSWPAKEYISRCYEMWRATGYCPNPGFYVARQSQWLSSLPDWIRDGFHHYVIDGNDGYVELIATKFKWREWLWSLSHHREDAPLRGPVVAEGEGVA